MFMHTNNNHTILREHRVSVCSSRRAFFRRPIARRAYLEAALVCAVMSSTVIMLPSMTLRRDLKQRA